MRNRKQHDYEVTLEMTIIVCNVTNREEAADGAKDLIRDEPSEYLDDAIFTKVDDLGESKKQL